MLALGAMALDLRGDLEIARKLTDGCVTVYNIMPSGVMPEYLDLIPCSDLRSCPWDEEAWLQTLLPGVNLHLPEPEQEPEIPTPVQKGPPKKEGAGGDDEDDEPRDERDSEGYPEKGLKNITENDEIGDEVGLKEEPLPGSGDYSQYRHSKRDPQHEPPPGNHEEAQAKLTPIQKAWNKAKEHRLPPGVTFVSDSRFDSTHEQSST